MKLRKDDKVIVIAGKYKGQTGKVLAVYPATGTILVENINVVKRHTKPSDKNPRGGILDITKPIDVSKVMVIDPATEKPARIGYVFKADGTKERIFKVSPNHGDKKAKVAKTEKVEKPEKADKTAEKTAKAGKK